MASSGKALATRRVRRGPATGEPLRGAVADVSEIEAMQLGDTVTQFNAATAKVLETADAALQAAQQGNRRIDELNRLILAKLDALDGRRHTW